MLIYEGGTESFSEFISDEVDASYAGCELESSFREWPMADVTQPGLII